MASTNNWPINVGSDGTAVTVTETSATIDIKSTAEREQLSDIMVDNPGPNDVFVRAGATGVTATPTSMRVPPGSVQPYYVGGASKLALICSPGLTQAVVVHVGSGQ